MNAKKCDRCGDFYTESPANTFGKFVRAIKQMAEEASPYINKSKEQQLIENVVDLCPKCSKSLTKWLANSDKEDCNGRQTDTRTDDT